jgi:hypothetical protein
MQGLTFLPTTIGETAHEVMAMRRERIEHRTPRRPRRLPEILPLDPRDPDIVRAKALSAGRVGPSDRSEPAAAGDVQS